jgi:hypothetical protein
VPAPPSPEERARLERLATIEARAKGLGFLIQEDFNKRERQREYAVFPDSEGIVKGVLFSSLDEVEAYLDEKPVVAKADDIKLAAKLGVPVERLPELYKKVGLAALATEDGRRLSLEDIKALIEAAREADEPS